MEAKIILFSHQKGGVGKTVVSTLVATELARSSKVILIDADPQGSSYLKRVEQVKENSKVPYELFHLPLIQDIATCINEYSTKVDYIIVDTKGELTKDIKTLVFNSDYLFIPMTAGDSDWSSLQTFIKSLQSLFIEHKPKVKVFGFYNRVRRTNRWNEYIKVMMFFFGKYDFINIPEMESLIPGVKQALQLAMRDEYESLDTITPISSRKRINWKVREEANNFMKAIIKIITN